MECRIAPYICQRMTNLVTFVHASLGYFLLNYVDDFVEAESASKIHASHNALVRFMRDTGIQRSERKSVLPAQVIEFVGNLFNTMDFTIGVMPGRKIEILRELEHWRNRAVCNRKQVESLVGKLQFMSNCICPVRLFISRLLAEMRSIF